MPRNRQRSPDADTDRAALHTLVDRIEQERRPTATAPVGPSLAVGCASLPSQRLTLPATSSTCLARTAPGGTPSCKVGVQEMQPSADEAPAGGRLGFKEQRSTASPTKRITVEQNVGSVNGGQVIGVQVHYAEQVVIEAGQGAAAPEPGEPPYKGLASYDVADAPRFFGHEQLTAELVGFLRQRSFLAIVGASGSGKSSLARRGGGGAESGQAAGGWRQHALGQPRVASSNSDAHGVRWKAWPGPLSAPAQPHVGSWTPCVGILLG